MADFFSSKAQPLFDDVLWLPQQGAKTGPSGRPPNSYAIFTNVGAIFVDAVFSWTLDGIRSVADAGLPPAAFVLTHRDLLDQGDAFEELVAAYTAPFLLHPADAVDAPQLGRAFGDPRGSDILKRAGYDVLEMPFHTPGSIMLHSERRGGILFTGDSAAGPGPRQAQEPARLERPVVGSEAEDAAFRAAWTAVLGERLVSSFLPLHGTPYLERHDAETVAEPLRTGAPIDPSEPAPVPAEGESRAAGVPG